MCDVAKEFTDQLAVLGRASMYRCFNGSWFLIRVSNGHKSYRSEKLIQSPTLLSFREFSFPSYLFLLFQHWFQILWYFYFMFNPWWTRNKLFKFLFWIFWIQLSILICQSHEIVFQTRQSTLSKLDSTFYEKILKTNIYLIFF